MTERASFSDFQADHQLQLCTPIYQAAHQANIPQAHLFYFSCGALMKQFVENKEMDACLSSIGFMERGDHDQWKASSKVLSKKSGEKALQDLEKCLKGQVGALVDELSERNYRVQYAPKSFSTVFPEVMDYVKNPLVDQSLEFEARDSYEVSREKMVKGLNMFYPEKMEQLRQCMKKNPDSRVRCNNAVMVAAYPILCKRDLLKCAQEWTKGVDNFTVMHMNRCISMNPACGGVAIDFIKNETKL